MVCMDPASRMAKSAMRRVNRKTGTPAQISSAVLNNFESGRSKTSPTPSENKAKKRGHMSRKLVPGAKK